MIDLIFATHNPHKVEEVSNILSPEDFHIQTLKDLQYNDEIIEDGHTLEENAKIKADTIYRQFGTNVMAEDTGLEIEALNMEPGVRTARYAGEVRDSNANMDKVLQLLERCVEGGDKNRKAQFRAVVALWFDNRQYMFEGVIRGEIAMTKKGTGGFGYDPIFVPEGYSQSFGQLSVEIKNRLSHRARAFKKVSDFFSQI